MVESHHRTSRHVRLSYSLHLWPTGQREKGKELCDTPWHHLTGFPTSLLWLHKQISQTVHTTNHTAENHELASSFPLPSTQDEMYCWYWVFTDWPQDDTHRGTFPLAWRLLQDDAQSLKLIFKFCFTGNFFQLTAGFFLRGGRGGNVSTGDIKIKDWNDPAAPDFPTFFLCASPK